MKIAFLGHTQDVHDLRPSGGYLTREDADRLVRELAAERVSKKKIRAFAPDSAFRRLASPNAPAPANNKLGSPEIPGLRFSHWPSQAGRYVADMHRLALKSFQHQLANQATL
jgi:hypothetical protein